MACTHWQVMEHTFSIIYRKNPIGELRSGLVVGDDAQLKRKQNRKDMTKRFNANRASCQNTQDSETKDAWNQPEPLGPNT